jgi:hypothetical protein
MELEDVEGTSWSGGHPKYNFIHTVWYWRDEETVAQKPHQGS